MTVAAPKQGETKYVAEWCVSVPEDPEFDAALCEYGISTHRTYGQAISAAIDNAAAGPMPDWWRVTKQVYDVDCYEQGAGGWEIVDVWIEGIRA